MLQRIAFHSIYHFQGWYFLEADQGTSGLISEPSLSTSNRTLNHLWHTGKLSGVTSEEKKDVVSFSPSEISTVSSDYHNTYYALLVQEIFLFPKEDKWEKRKEIRLKDREQGREETNFPGIF